MKQLKALILGIIAGFIIGLWFGINLGKDRPIYSNPFTEASVQEKLKQTGETIIEKSGDALEKGGKALKEQIDKNK